MNRISAQIKDEKRIHYFLLGLISVVFVATRLFRLDSVPFTAWGMELDELGAAYDAWCIQGWGVDRHLIKLPLVFLNLGDGQNALYIYLAAIIFKIFGFSLFKFRFVAVICASCAYICLYFLSRKIFGNTPYSVIPNALMTIMPVFLMSEHWGLESYLLLSFSIISFYYLTKAIDSGKIVHYVIDGILWGLTFYSYGIAYVVVPLFLICVLIYLLYLGKISIPMIIAEVIPIIIFGVPLLIEQLVISRIIQPFSLKYMDFFPTERVRWGEISLNCIPQNILRAPYILFVKDNMGYINSPLECFGTVFYLSIPFLIAGFIISIGKAVKSIKNKEFDVYSLVLLFFLVSLLVALMTQSLRIVSANEIYFPLLIFTSTGIATMVRKIDSKWVTYLLALAYCIYFVFFVKWMYSGADGSWSYLTRPQLEEYIFVDIHTAEAAKEAKEQCNGRSLQMIVNNGGDSWYESVCLYLGTSPYDYNREGFDENGYSIGVPEGLDLSGETVYLIEDKLHDITDYLVSEGFKNEVVTHGGYSIVTKGIQSY